MKNGVLCPEEYWLGYHVTGIQEYENSYCPALCMSKHTNTVCIRIVIKGLLNNTQHLINI